MPEGFTIERVDPEGQIRFPMFAAFDERGRLFVTESSGLDLYAEISALTRKCRISVLEDADGDGRFEKSAVFADKLVMPMGAAWRDGKLYVPDGPDLVALEDTDGDGRADQRSVILSGFGHYDNGGLHGITFGPDGWLYMTCGQPDGFKLKRADGSFLESKSGSLLRCRPDGRDVQVLSRGFENLVEVVFFPTGEVVGTVNWYQRPEGGIRDALVHLMHGGLYPYVPDVGTPQLVSGPLLPAVAKFPAVALSGLELLEGEALGSEFRGQLFSAQHNSRKVGRHVFHRDGATFRSEDFDFVTSANPDFHPSDVLEDADGSLIVADTGSWYIHHCPTGQIRNSPATGGVYRVRRSGAPVVKDPRGLGVDWKKAEPEALTTLLGDARPAVRRRAQDTLALRGSTALPALTRTLESATDLPVIQRALWTASRIEGDAAAALLRDQLGAKNTEVVATAARALGARGDKASADALCDVLGSTAPPHARAAAAEALGYAGDADALPAVWVALAASPAPDRMLEHALVFAAHHLADAAALQAALKHPGPRVQSAAMLLLDQPPRPKGALAAGAAFQRLGAPGESLREAAMERVVRHPEWAAQAREFIGERWGWSDLPLEDERALLRLVLAFESDKAIREMVLGLMRTTAHVRSELRAPLLEVIGRSRLSAAPPEWVEAVERSIESPDAAVRAAAVRAAAALQAPALDDELAFVAGAENWPAPLRMEALHGVIGRRPRLQKPAFELLLAQLGKDAPPAQRLAAAAVAGRAELTGEQARQVLAAVRGDALVSPGVMLPALARVKDEGAAGEVISYLSESLARGWEPSGEQIEPVLASFSQTRAADVEKIRAALRARLSERRATLEGYEPLLTGGDAARGRAVFFGNKVACGTCHRVGDEGGRVGPDLTKVGAIRAGRDILESIVLPSSTIAQGYDHYVAQTNGGEVYAGVVPQPHADVIEIRDAAGNSTRLHKDRVKRIQRQPMSLMPDGLAGAMTAEEFRDLLAYLQSLR